jgi:hypothetical protein
MPRLKRSEDDWPEMFACVGEEPFQLPHMKVALALTLITEFLYSGSRILKKKVPFLSFVEHGFQHYQVTIASRGAEFFSPFPHLFPVTQESLNSLLIQLSQGMFPIPFFQISMSS